ncbi:Cytochrome P450 [Macleaya cordata]|uniref:Cytochrome P450 n=1 Tax=Macleaya cordata TaxID=56857 RepID=A0A200Q3J4_MACCD|nr:Cytochrome P450 [Macleaya cordata]
MYICAQGWTRGMKAVSKVVDEFFEKIIDEHVQDARKQQEHHKDFIDVLLSLMDAQQEAAEQLSRSNIKAIMLDMLVGAMDTSATAVEWALAELYRNPRVMKRVQQELETVVGLDRLVEESDLVKLEYLEMVVKETMRLHPVAPLLVPHESMEDIKINGYDIPKKSRVIVNIWAIGRDPRVWSHNADEFYPERFEGVDIDVRGHDFRLIPFGSGRRGCRGMQLGLTMIRLILAQLVHCFEWKLPNGMSPHDLDMGEKFGLSVPMANHLIAIPNYRLVS